MIPIRMVRVPLCLFVAMAAVVLSSCGKGPVAAVNGQRITARDFYAFAGKGQLGANALTGIILERLVLQAAQKQGVTVTQKEIDDKVAEQRKSLQDIPDAPSLEDLLKTRFLTWDDYLWQLRLNLMLEKLCTKGVEVTDEKIKAYFDQNRAKMYDKPDRVSLHVMALATRKEADDARKQLLAGTAFDTLAQQKSLLWAQQGADLGQVERGSSLIPDSLFQAAWSLNVGEISQPVQVNNLYYLLRLDQKVPAEPADFEKIKSQAREDYLRDNGTPPELFLNQLRQDAKVDVLWPDFAELQKRFAPPSTPAAAKGTQTLPAAPPAQQSPPAPAPTGKAAQTKPGGQPAAQAPPAPAKAPATPR